MRTFWIIVAMGVVTYAVRALPFFLLANRELPPLAGRALRYVPAAVLSAIAVPEILQPATAPADLFIWLAPGNFRLWAGLVAIAVAHFSKNVLLTIAAGMATFWLLSAMI